MNLTPLKTLPSIFIQAALVTTAGVLALVLITKYVAPIPLNINQTTTQKDSAFMVTGKSTITTAPDKAVVTAGITRTGTSLKQTQADANAIMKALQDKLAALGVKPEDIKTTNYSINPNINYPQIYNTVAPAVAPAVAVAPNAGTAEGSAPSTVAKIAQPMPPIRPDKTISGYTVNISIEISLTNFDTLNQVIDAATAAGANQVGNVQFSLSDAKQKDVQSQARAQAIADAKTNADELARLAGMHLGKIINVTEGQNYPGPIMYAKAMDSVQSAGGTPTSVQPGTTTYNYTVTLSYEIN